MENKTDHRRGKPSSQGGVIYTCPMHLLEKQNLSCTEIVSLLQAEGNDKKELFERSSQLKQQYVQNKVYFRGLIEFSNICSKDCYYCGIRKSNLAVNRFNLSDNEIIEAARFAYENRYGSIVLQSGEIKSHKFTDRISKILYEIQKMSGNNLRVTLSCGEQDYTTYKKWYDNGASRYLLRIETSNKDLYYKLHPEDISYSFIKRKECLNTLKSIGFQVGTGVMIGLPFQTIEDLARDLLWMKELDVDMVGMGPYLEHRDTPLFAFRNILMDESTRFELSLKMIAVLRIMMRKINIVAATALQAIEKLGREKAIMIGANVLMPNITPGSVRDDYKLYENKPCTSESPDDCKSCLEMRIALTGNRIAYDEWGDSQHFVEKGTR